MKRWKILNSSRLSVHGSEQIQKILLENRGVKTEKETGEFLSPKLERVTIDSVGIDLKQIKKAIALIKKTIKEGKAIVIYGDYDVDGICGTAILWETIYSFYKNVHPYIPHRVDEGYGLSPAGISNFKFIISNVGLVITVDNGIVANKAVDFAKLNNIQVIITDHHTKSSTLPKADAIVHTTELCGTSVAYLLAKEISNFKFPIFNQFKKQKFPNEEKHLELVALATVADLVPLNKYNRTLLKFGLEKLRKTKRPGLLALFDEAEINKEEIGTYHIGHMIAPRLNASGRITHALDSLRLICTMDKVRAKKLAKQLGEVNKERQQLTMDSALDAINRVRSENVKGESRSEGEGGVRSLIFVENEMYEQGVIGLIASRLVEEFYRPAIAVSIGKEISKGSARSIKGVNIIELIRSSSKYLAEAGGHPMAAGFSIKTENLEAFKKTLIKKAEEIDKSLFERVLKIDLELPFALINLELYSALQALAPFGIGNPEPVFITIGVTVVGLRKVGRDGQHLQVIFQKNGINSKGILFKFDQEKIKVGDMVDIVYIIVKNEWNGKTSIELKIKDLIFS